MKTQFYLKIRYVVDFFIRIGDKGRITHSILTTIGKKYGTQSQELSQNEIVFLVEYFCPCDLKADGDPDPIASYNNKIN